MAGDKSFLDTLRDIRRGDVIGELTAELANLVAAVRGTGNKGEISLTIKVKPASKGEIFALVIEDEVKVKLPKFPKGTTVLFANEENVLLRKDPRQPELTGLQRPATVTNIGEAVV